jgi:hypothetical protein
MKVKQLIKLLQDLDPNYNVVLSKDSEGNEFSPAAELMVAQYHKETDYSGWIRIDEDREPDEDPIKKNCVVIWPTN